MGPILVATDTHASLVKFAGHKGDLVLTGPQSGDDSEHRVGDMLRLVAPTREYQRA